VEAPASVDMGPLGFEVALPPAGPSDPPLVEALGRAMEREVLGRWIDRGAGRRREGREGGERESVCAAREAREGREGVECVDPARDFRYLRFVLYLLRRFSITCPPLKIGY